MSVRLLSQGGLIEHKESGEAWCQQLGRYQHLPLQCVPSLFAVIVNQSLSDALFSWMYFISAVSSCAPRFARPEWNTTARPGEHPVSAIEDPPAAETYITAASRREAVTGSQAKVASKHKERYRLHRDV